MSLLKKMTPINLLEEKGKFFSDFSYNPQFQYREEIDNELISRYGKIDQKILELAKEIIKKSYHHRNQQDLKMIEGKILQEDEVAEKIIAYLKLHHLEHRFEASWSSSYVARTSITGDLIKLRLPCTFRKQGLMGMLYHEIGTHALRRVNYEKQPWYKKKKKNGFSNYLKTEEGLASLHSLIPKSFQLAHISALKYIMASVAQNKSFTEMWRETKKYIPDPEARWTFCVRLKRGMTDTSHGGFNSKSLVYFGGMVEVWQWLNKHEFDVAPLYWGKMAWQDVAKAQQLNPHFSPQLPHFFTSDPSAYMKTMSKIGEINLFNQLQY